MKDKTKVTLVINFSVKCIKMAHYSVQPRYQIFTKRLWIFVSC